ncbi:MAG: UvrB/UvrC motif-containing protein [Verrucomicrobiota bacterium]
MNHDLSGLLRDWEYQPGQVVARRFTGEDGTDKIQLRVDLGVLQMNVAGRPDGKRPMGQETWFDVIRQRLEEHREEHDGDDAEFVLTPEDLTRLQQECIQFHHRYICFFQLGDYAAVARDCERNMEVFQFVAHYAATAEAAWSLLQFLPQLILMRTRARGSSQLKRRRFEKAIETIEASLNELEEFYREHEREDLLEGSGEIHSLRQWLEEVRHRKPLSEVEKLRRALAEAIRTEDYEAAARVRDELRKLESPGS